MEVKTRRERRPGASTNAKSQRMKKMGVCEKERWSTKKIERERERERARAMLQEPFYCCLFLMKPMQRGCLSVAGHGTVVTPCLVLFLFVSVLFLLVLSLLHEAVDAMHGRNDKEEQEIGRWVEKPCTFVETCPVGQSGGEPQKEKKKVNWFDYFTGPIRRLQPGHGFSFCSF